MKLRTRQPLARKVYIVTGATSGIGRATALGLAGPGARVAVIGRSEARGQETVREIRKATGEEADFLLADLSSQAEVRKLAGEILDRYPQIHAIVNNAAVIIRKRALTVDGIETQFAVNHLAPFLLTNLLLDRLKESAPSRVVNVASQVESTGTIDFEDLGLEKRYDPLHAYAQSKLANVLFTYELASRLQGTGVSANCLHPGVIATRLLDDYIGRPRMLGFVTRLKNPPPSEGARTSIYLAASREVEGVSGKYFQDSREVSSSPRSRDPELAKRLWEVSARLTGVT